MRGMTDSRSTRWAFVATVDDFDERYFDSLLRPLLQRLVLG